MDFSSLFFLWAFFPVTLLLYYLAGLLKNRDFRLKLQNVVLLVLSLIFYAFGGFGSLLLVAALTVVTYISGILISKYNCKRVIAGITVALLLLILSFFKYAGLVFTDSGIIMPLAFSFVIFQSVSYIVDVYRGTVHAEKNILVFGLYIFLFAQLVQGPIMRYGDLGSQIRDRECSLKKFVSGIKRFCYGLGKKVIVANTVALAADKIWNTGGNGISTGTAWLGLILYAIQIYYDFSGYSDMAVGTGLMLGFKVSENFNYPYTSFSVQEFWRRWHISLSSWFRDYLYIPLGGNRRGKARTLVNLGVVFLATGIWHGVDLTFIIWGAWHGIFLVIERVFLGDILKKNPVKILNWIYTIFVVATGWIFFRAGNVSEAFAFLRILFVSTPGEGILSFLNMNLLIALAAGIIFAGGPQRALAGLYKKVASYIPVRVVDFTIQMLILVWAVILVVSGSYNPSIYGAF